MVLVCQCGSHALEFTYQHYPEDEDGFATGIATEEYECAHCGKTGTFRFGEKNGRHIEEMSGCLTTKREPYL